MRGVIRTAHQVAGTGAKNNHKTWSIHTSHAGSSLDVGSCQQFCVRPGWKLTSSGIVTGVTPTTRLIRCKVDCSSSTCCDVMYVVRPDMCGALTCALTRAPYHVVSQCCGTVLWYSLLSTVTAQRPPNLPDPWQVAGALPGTQVTCDADTRLVLRSTSGFALPTKVNSVSTV